MSWMLSRLSVEGPLHHNYTLIYTRLLLDPKTTTLDHDARPTNIKPPRIPKDQWRRLGGAEGGSCPPKSDLAPPKENLAPNLNSQKCKKH